MATDDKSDSDGSSSGDESFRYGILTEEDLILEANGGGAGGAHILFIDEVSK